jgi:anti-sigma B factor antagonist
MTDLPEAFSATLEGRDGRVRVVLRGELDFAAAAAAGSALMDACNRGEPVEVDLSGLSFLDSSGLRALVAARHHADREQRRMIVVDASPQAARVLELTNTDDWLRGR